MSSASIRDLHVLHGRRAGRRLQPGDCASTGWPLGDVRLAV
jgi:hypothetical protein